MQRYVSNLAWVLMEDELRRLFYGYGAVERVRIITDRETGCAQGLGYIDMPHATEAPAAIAGLNETSLGGRALMVNEARQREERRPRGEGEGRRPRW